MPQIGSITGSLRSSALFFTETNSIAVLLDPQLLDNVEEQQDIYIHRLTLNQP
jgi:hypothetical protein